MAKMKTNDAPLVTMARGGLTENVHYGRVAVVSVEDGKLVGQCGDAQAPAYWRSTGKPIQAIASLLGGAAETYGYEERHLALMAASHTGSSEQIAVLEEILALTGLAEDALAIGPSLPYDIGARDRYAAGGGAPRKLFHGCAGKHLGLLAWSKMNGWPLAGYLDPAHPAQREVLRRIKLWTGAPDEEVTVGRDGCGFPVAAMPLWRLAYAYGQLASPELARDREGAPAAARMAAAMNAYPALVEGARRLASMLLADSNVVAKSGAHGVFAIGLRREKLGIAFAVTGGSDAAWPHIAMAVLARTGGLAEATWAKLREAWPAEYLNDVGEPAGRWDAVFQL